MNTYINVNAIQDGSIPISKLAGSVGGDTTGCLMLNTENTGWIGLDDTGSDGSYINGSLTIGTNIVSTDAELFVDGSAKITNQVSANGGFYETSDERKKNFAEPIDVDFEKLKMLKKNYFFWKDSDNKDRQLGVSAQEIQAVYPELVVSDSNGELSVDYAKLSVVALKAIDNLHDKNVELEKRITDLEKVVDVLLTRVC